MCHPNFEARVRSALAQLNKWASAGKAVCDAEEFSVKKRSSPLNHGDHHFNFDVMPISIIFIFPIVDDDYSIFLYSKFIRFCCHDDGYPYAASFIMANFPAFSVKVMCNLLESAPRQWMVCGKLLLSCIIRHKTLDCFDMFEEYMYCSDPTGRDQEPTL
ncbi:hypothetical protein CEXT_128871 [Caerostris extrusa]|uniref:Uncharacterized protein n=1 Tax=Caerostris extrusa TaxID=172846 RepID=A0AAV4T3H8_CAEEX|nr:hypothetical protein CEXT_128871 [Caerostris extrusa]